MAERAANHLFERSVTELTERSIDRIGSRVASPAERDKGLLRLDVSRATFQSQDWMKWLAPSSTR
jgi:hypothetical protein